MGNVYSQKFWKLHTANRVVSIVSVGHGSCSEIPPSEQIAMRCFAMHGCSSNSVLCLLDLVPFSPLKKIQYIVLFNPSMLMRVCCK